jgi:hypothetical protein
VSSDERPAAFITTTQAGQLPNLELLAATPAPTTASEPRKASPAEFSADGVNQNRIWLAIM